MLTIKIQNKDGITMAVGHGEDQCGLVYANEYKEGDLIVIEINEPVYLMVKLDETLESSLVYMKENLYFDIPFNEKKICYSPISFTGDRHYIFVRKAEEYETKAYRNLALNTADSHRDCKCFPHATANVETRGEAVFAARNAIDGIVENHSHGEWPYGSWGINRDKNAQLKLDFGREVEVDKIRLFERADFPHDNWWKEVTFEFSNGDKMTCQLKKTDLGQDICFEKKKIEWLILKNLIQSDEPSPFPALAQIEVYGTDL